MLLVAIWVPAAVFPSSLPANAQSSQFPFDFPSPDFPGQRQAEPLGVEIELATDRDSDVIGIYNASTSGEGSRYYNELGSAVADALNVKRSKSDVNVVDDEFDTQASGFDGGAPEGFDVTVDVEDRLASRNGDSLQLRFDSSELRRVASMWGFQGLELYICSSLPLDDKSQRRADDADGDCLSWNAAASSSAIAVDVTVEAKPGDYWNLLGVLALVSLGLTLLSAVLMRLARRGFLATLDAGNLVFICSLVLIAFTGWAIAAGVLGVIGRPVDDIVVAEDFGWGGHVVAVTVPALLFALPAMAAAIVLTYARPPEPRSAQPIRTAGSQPEAPGGPPGAPSWLGATAAPVEPAPQQQSGKPDDEAPPSWHAPT